MPRTGNFCNLTTMASRTPGKDAGKAPAKKTAAKKAPAAGKKAASPKAPVKKTAARKPAPKPAPSPTSGVYRLARAGWLGTEAHQDDRQDRQQYGDGNDAGEHAVWDGGLEQG